MPVLSLGSKFLVTYTIKNISAVHRFYFKTYLGLETHLHLEPLPSCTFSRPFLFPTLDVRHFRARCRRLVAIVVSLSLWLRGRVLRHLVTQSVTNINSIVVLLDLFLYI
jgi:hypothetical protein